MSLSARDLQFCVKDLSNKCLVSTDTVLLLRARWFVYRVWDMETLECVKVLQGHNEAVLALAVGPSFLVSGSYDTTVRFWALDSLRCVRCCILHLSEVGDLHTCSSFRLVE